ncbi:hypothetical protein [Jiangella asiatica]|uniref:Uncharacterized protein n=1 Tax=Jiangella asiatica TaxID=2530372 RepID=A0A4R5D7X5_9ACTN|nr:hypothetical protein [Jiangella asiatica]TDE09642.1 hypothetical protein E1269_13465 [Jiangella asiatica]
MSGFHTDAPGLLPVLSKGKHRNARKGACFMEFASYLAGERWSDHPSCTHPLLAAVARLVNDAVSDDYRPQLAPLVPRVIGVDANDARMDVAIALRVAATALPVASAERQRVLAVALLSAERILDGLDDRPAGALTEGSRVALEHVPVAAAWAREFAEGEQTTLKGFRRYAAPTAVRCAVEGIANACVPDPDRRLHELLELTIDDCARLVSPARRSTDPDRWAAACRLTGTA